jgi:hypothetical protein
MGLICFDELNPAEKSLIGTWELVNEVYNGGFTQYFHNSSREHAAPMIAVFLSIGAQRAAAILESAIALAGPGTRWDDEPHCFAAINSTPSDLKRRLVELERELYDELDDLHLLVFRYLSKHRDQIDAPADFWTEATII